MLWTNLPRLVADSLELNSEVKKNASQKTMHFAGQRELSQVESSKQLLFVRFSFNVAILSSNNV